MPFTHPHKKEEGSINLAQKCLQLLVCEIEFKRGSIERSACKIFTAASSVTCVPSTCILTLCMCVYFFSIYPYCTKGPLPNEPASVFTCRVKKTSNIMSLVFSSMVENRRLNLLFSADLVMFWGDLKSNEAASTALC